MQGLFFSKVAALNFNKKETLAQVFSCAFCEISKNTFFTEHLWWLLLYSCPKFNLNVIVVDMEILFLEGYCNWVLRSSHPEVFLRKGVLKICSKFTGEHPCRSVISIKLLCRITLIEITLRHGCSSVNLLHIFRTPFLKNTFGRLLLDTLKNVAKK